MIWDRFFYFPSGWRHAENFHARKIQRLRPGLNPQTWVLEASMLTTRLPKPSTLDIRSYQSYNSFATLDIRSYQSYNSFATLDIRSCQSYNSFFTSDIRSYQSYNSLATLHTHSCQSYNSFATLDIRSCLSYNSFITLYTVLVNHITHLQNQTYVLVNLI